MVVFKKGQLVQIYRTKLAQTLSTECKLAPLWSPPHQVTERLLNSYRLETLDGTPLDGKFSARCLRGFTPREGTELAMQQKKFEDRITVQEPDEDMSDNTEVVVGTAGGDGDEIAGEDSHALLLEDL